MCIFAAPKFKQMEAVAKTKKPRKANSTKEKQRSDLSKIFGVAKGRIFFDDSIFNLGTRREKVCNGIS